jgi:hypothetical protein
VNRRQLLRSLPGLSVVPVFAAAEEAKPVKAKPEVEFVIGKAGHDSRVIVNGVDISGACRRATITMEAGKLTSATVELMHVKCSRTDMAREQLGVVDPPPEVIVQIDGREIAKQAAEPL